MELSARKEIRVRIAGAAIWVAAAILTLSLLLPAFFSAGLWTPSRISDRVSSTDVTFHYSSDEKTVRITSNSEEYVWPLAPFMVNRDTDRQNLLLASEHFDVNPAIAFAFSNAVQSGKIDRVVIDTDDYQEVYRFLRASDGSVRACQVRDSGSGIPDFTLQFKYDSKGRFQSAFGDYIPQRDEDRKHYEFSCQYGADGGIQKIRIINQNDPHLISFQKDSTGRFIRLTDRMDIGTEEETSYTTQISYDTRGRLREETNDRAFGSTIYQYRRNGTLRAIQYKNRKIHIHYVRL